MGTSIAAPSQTTLGMASGLHRPEDPQSLRQPERTNLLDPEMCWQAIYSRDPRFDGRFFAAATTTGLYCRNVCPVPFARPRNVILFACAAAAESAGFRPCKRCHPQAAPGTPAWLGTSAVVSRAFRLILEGALNDGSVEQLSARLGLGSRQLRRLFVQHLGASPIKIATTHRVHLARKLIDESSLPMTQIALCSGFKSIREFNHAVRLSTGQSPSKLRHADQASQPAKGSSGLELRLPYRTPFDWAALVAFLKRRAVPGVELVTEDSYRRTIEIGGSPGFLTVRPDQGSSRLIATLHTASYVGLAQTVERIRRIFDLGADPVQIAAHLGRDPGLAKSLQLHPGLRLPGVWEGFEAATLSLLGQRLTRLRPSRVAARLVRQFGTPLSVSPGSPKGLAFLFPGPQALAKADLTSTGMDEPTARRVQRLAAAVLSGKISFATSRTLEDSVAQLRATCGIDESTAHYIAMQAFGEPDAFPSNDSGLRRGLADLQPKCPPGTTTHALDRTEEWRPWRAYAAMHIAQASAQETNLS